MFKHEPGEVRIYVYVNKHIYIYIASQFGGLLKKIM